MPYYARRILFVFAHHLDEDVALQKDIRHYEKIVRQTTVLEFPLPEYFILVVSPHISAHFQCTPEIQDYARRNSEESIKRLEHIGTVLGIPPEQRYFAKGTGNLKAWRLSKELNIDEVHGYTKGFVRFLERWETAQSRWQRFFNRPSWSEVFKRCKQCPQHAIKVHTDNSIKIQQHSQKNKHRV